MAGHNNGFYLVIRTRDVVMSSRTSPLIPCFQVAVRFAFSSHKAVLVSTHIKPQKAPAFLALSGLPCGRGLKYRRFFHSEKEASAYAAHLRRLYAGRIVPGPVFPGGQLSLF
jgi:hypothetical protein